MENLKISVIVPVYNVEKYLEECLDSICKQNFNDCEIICVDDGSTDRSSEILKRYAQNDPKIQVISQSNGGLSRARNAGIQMAKGKYICFLDSDDLLAPHSLERLYETAEEKDIDILCYDMAYILYEDVLLKEKYHKSNYYTRKNVYHGVQRGKKLFVEMMQQDDFCNSAVLIMLRRTWLKEKGILFYPGICYEDSLFSVQCFLECERIRHVKMGSYIYRVRTDSIMTNSPKYENLYSYLVCYKELLKIMFSVSEKEVKEALGKYVLLTLASVKYTDRLIGEEERKRYHNLPAEERLLADSLGITAENLQENEKIYLQGFEDRIIREQRIVLYGAGKVGRMVFQYLKDKHLENKIKCFAVTDHVNDPSEILGIPVYSIADLDNREKDLLVIITARKNYHSEMQEILKNTGFKNTVVIDDWLEGIIEKRGKP